MICTINSKLLQYKVFQYKVFNEGFYNSNVCQIKVLLNNVSSVIVCPPTFMPYNDLYRAHFTAIITICSLLYERQALQIYTCVDRVYVINCN